MIKKFIGYYKPHLRLFIIDMLAAIIIAVCNLFYPTVVRKIINEYVYNETAKALIIASVFLTGIYVIKAVCDGANIKVYVDDKLVIDYTDATPWLHGMAGIRYAGGTTQYDDLKITKNN